LANKVLNNILIIKGPSSLPKNCSHKEAIESLASQHKLVILFCFGDDAYDIPPNYILPTNVRTIHYAYETLDQSLDEVKECLKGFGVGIISRHKNELDPLPFILTGSILQVPSDTELSFFSGKEIQLTEEESVVADEEWDLL
jgi:hypothetical protein